MVHVVPHTHWDREWYLPFAVYRRNLIRLIDSLLEALHREGGLRFHLDGQMALIDDYLELRPEKLAEIRLAAASGRISLGPWYTLPDEHLVSGESLLRNLEAGLARAAELGRPLEVGYLPDQFGHTAQMPQLLRRAGLRVAVLWRGVPASITSSVFEWEAPDGSAVEVIHLRNGYGHGKLLPIEPAELASRLEVEVEDQLPANQKGPWLVMNGDDHLPVPVGLAAALERMEPLRPAAISSLRDFAAERPPPRGRHVGELHSAASSFILKGTLSARFPLKLRHAALERRLERYIEPLWTLSGLPWPRLELGYAWRQLLLNSAHDSICGCSIDQVHEEASGRLRRAEEAAGNLWHRLGGGGEQVHDMFNPSPFQRAGVPGLGVGPAAPVETVPAPEVRLDLRFEDQGDRGDEYTFQPDGDPVQRIPLEAELQATREGELTRIRVVVDNQTRNHRLRLLIPAETGAGCWAGASFGAVQRSYRAPGTESGAEYDQRTDPARGWVDAGGTAVLLAGPFEYELLPGWVAVTLLRCVEWLSRGDLEMRPGHAGPGLLTPAAQMFGRHEFEIGLLEHGGGWREVPRWAEIFAHPLVPAANLQLRSIAPIEDPLTILSALRRGRSGAAELRTYDLRSFRITDRELEI